MLKSPFGGIVPHQPYLPWQYFRGKITSLPTAFTNRLFLSILRIQLVAYFLPFAFGIRTTSSVLFGRNYLGDKNVITGELYSHGEPIEGFCESKNMASRGPWMGFWRLSSFFWTISASLVDLLDSIWMRFSAGRYGNFYDSILYSILYKSILYILYIIYPCMHK